MDSSYILTGYTDISLSRVKSLLETPNDMKILIDKFVDISQCQYSNDDEGVPIGLEGSSLLAGLSWLTPWKELFNSADPVKVF